MVVPALLICGLALAIVGSIEIGYQFGLALLRPSPDLSRWVSSPIEGPIFGLMSLLIAFISALIGYSLSASGGRDWRSIVLFTLVVSTAIYVILDYEYPRLWLIRVDAADRALRQVLENMK
jgi:hypothetical protein